jgi:hypothetical protein
MIHLYSYMEEYTRTEFGLIEGEPESEPVGEKDERAEIATSILRRADVVMESWQVANALIRMSSMIPKDKARRQKLRTAAEAIVSSFIDNMLEEQRKETAKDGERWKQYLAKKDDEWRAVRALKIEETRKIKRAKKKVRATSDGEGDGQGQVESEGKEGTAISSIAVSMMEI